MDKADRIKYLENLIQEEPDDPFGYYALCLEWEGSPASKAEKWEQMLIRFPEYLPSYYQAGEALKQAGQKDKALEVWKKGIELAGFQGDLHALAELKSALQNAMIDEDDE
jgi:tetratricopeptide (TPR) repeat protein